MPIRFLLVAFAYVAMLPYGGSASATSVHKCPLPGGGHEYRGTPCEDGNEVQVRDPTQPRGSAASRMRASELYGDWCKIGLSLTEDGEVDRDTQVQWTFGSDTVQYRMARGLAAGNALRHPLRREGDAIFVDDPGFGGPDGAWRVVGERGGAVLLESPVGGYHHLRRGSCP